MRVQEKENKPRDEKGRFVKGYHYSSSTEFQNGHFSWNKGRRKHTDAKLREIGDKISRALKGKPRPNSRLKPNLTSSKESYYLVGALKGDGHVSSRGQIKFTSTEKMFAKSVYNMLKMVNLNPAFYVNKRRRSSILNNREIHSIKPQFTIDASSKNFAEWYNTLDMNQILEKDEYVTAFLKGFYESEGTCGAHKEKNGKIYPRLSIANKNKKLLDFVGCCLLKAGFNFRVYGPYPPYQMYRVDIPSSQVPRFMKVVKPTIKRWKHKSYAINPEELKNPN